MEIESRLLNETKTIIRSYKRVMEATGQEFNIFSILRAEYNEVETHSRFLAELLNPNGSHRLKNTFLKKFVERFEIRDFTTERVQVITEHHVGKVTPDAGGRIDIFIKDHNSNVIMIENKIYAGEQHNQLMRYMNAYPNGKLFYLTLFGNESSQENLDSLQYTSISYEKDIIEWLEDCRKESVAVPIVRETILQYINLVKKITNQNSNKEMSKEIVEKILDNQETFEAYKTLVNSKQEVLKNILENHLFVILDEMAEKYNLELYLEKDMLLRNNSKWKGFGFKTPKMNLNNIKISFSFNVASGYKSLIYGYTYGNTIDKGSNENIRNLFQHQFGPSSSSNWWIAFKSYDQFSNWEELATLKKIAFGNFKEDFEDKLSKMLQIINEAYQ